MKVLKYKYNPDKKGVFRVSIVKNPAVGEGDLVLMSAQEIKGVFYSPVMIPDVKIQRIDPSTGEKYLVYYDAETVERLANNYFKHNGNANTNIEHQDSDTEGVYPVESWIVVDPETDKSKALGMPIQVKGTWIMGYKCESEEILQKVQNQLLQGLSIEGHLDTEEDTDSPISKFSKEKSMFDKIKEKIGDILTLMSSEDQEEKTPEVVEEEKPIEEMAEEMPMEEENNEPSELEAAQATIVELQKKVDDLEAEKAKNENDATLMSAELDEVKKSFDSYKAVKMSSQKLADVPVEKKDYSKMTALEKFRAKK